MSDKARLAAYFAVKRVFDGAFSNLINIGDELDGLDRAFAENIAIGTLERKITLEFVLDEFIQKNTKKELVYLLMTGVYQILYMDRVPDNASCDETVNLVKELFGKKDVGFANAVLRNVCRNKDKIVEKINNADVSVKYSVNEKLFAMLKSQYPNDFDRIFNAFFGKNDMYLRVNTVKTDAQTVALKVDGDVIGNKTVLCHNPKKAIEHINDGEFIVQGLASQKAVELLSVNSGQTVIDVCACPGGKSIGAAIDMNNEGRIFSFDIHQKKLPLIQKTADKLGISIIKTDLHDARKVKEELIGIADRVICDVPCSGTGVMGSKPEIKYKSPDDFEGLYPTQKAIIDSASKYLTIGGIMVYSTCSINKKENEDTVNEFLMNNKGYSLIHEETCLPFGDEKEGFYMAKIIRES